MSGCMIRNAGALVRAVTLGSLLSIAAVLSGCNAPASPPRLLNLDNMTAEQINGADAIDVAHSYAALNEDEEERRTAMAEAPGRLTAEVRYALATLYYPVNLSSSGTVRQDRVLQGLIREFERKLLDHLQSTARTEEAQWVAVDGQATWFEFNQLWRIAGLARTTPLIADAGSADHPYVSVFQRGQYGWATAMGSWQIENEQIAFPVNWSRIECDLAQGVCNVLNTDVSAPSARSLATELPWYQVHPAASPDRFEVVRWSADVIEARSVPSLMNQDCRFTTLTINEGTNSVSMVTQDGERPCEVGGRVLPRLERPRVTTLQPSSRVVSAHLDELYAYVEQFHGALARESYARPFTGGRN
jgi:hypothetical protein